MAADTARPDRTYSAEARERLERILAAQRAAFAKERYPSRETRLVRLDALIRAVESNEDRLVAAVNADFGNRARVETLIAEIVVTIGAARHARRNLARWMRPRGVATPLPMLPGRSRIEPQPLGVVGIIAPWNYPVQLALSPAAAALAAGDRVMIKPSELTPRTSETLAVILSKEFDETVLTVVTGGVETGEAFARLAFDHLLFTGSTAVGRKVALAAAETLTPVTLELGGKSPAILDASADLAQAARSIAHGKTFNAGQTCVAPDYVLAPKDTLDATVEAIAEAARALYPQIDTTADYTAIVSDRHFARLKAMIEEAREAGAKIVEIGSQNALHPQRKIPFTIVVEPPGATRLMQEEIFGPVLPVLGVQGAADAIARVNAGERPLALYWFGRDAAARERVLKQTVAGGVTVNDTLWHVAQENLPFGGVGQSGVGAYHGEAGFETFSHMKPVFYQSRFSSGGRLHPPFTKQTESVVKLMRKLV
jgi:coniferyl-aldehyde dehydrogenase